nr:hypothetical protein [Tanacetum cinerariifolium]
MDNPNINMEEYIRLEEERARRHVSPLNNNKIDFRISFDESDDEDYTICDNGDLSTYWREISSEVDFLGIHPSYTHIRDPMLRLYHRLIACHIAERSQAPEKVTVTDLFYPRSMDVGSVNIPYLLARYLRRFSSGRKHQALISRG